MFPTLYVTLPIRTVLESNQHVLRTTSKSDVLFLIFFPTSVPFLKHSTHFVLEYYVTLEEYTLLKVYVMCFHPNQQGILWSELQDFRICFCFSMASLIWHLPGTHFRGLAVRPDQPVKPNEFAVSGNLLWALDGTFGLLLPSVLSPLK